MNRHFAWLLLLISVAAEAQVKLPPLFSDNMVLQQQTEAPIWGSARPGKTVEITTSWDRKEYTVKADGQGRWKTEVATPEAGGPYRITISDGQRTTLENVMIGEVWICSGQSNMEMPIEGWGRVKNYEQEKKDAENYPDIRFLTVEKTTNTTPADELKVVGNGWQVCSAKAVADFSAVGYFFGRDIHKYRNVPVGLISAAWGGTIIEAWTSKEALSTMPSMQKRLAALSELPVSKEEREKKYRSDMDEWKRKLEKIDKGFSDGKPAWAGSGFDDRDWQTMKIPGLIQEQYRVNFNGAVWFRKSITLPDNWVEKDLTLNIGTVDDLDFTYFNGVQVGHTEGWTVSRSYKIPKELVKDRKAVIAVRVIDTGGTGGINGKPENVSLRLSESEAIQLAGDWKYKVSLDIRDAAPVPINTANEPNVPGILFNAMLNPLIPYGIKGAIWYQGENNVEHAYSYRELLPLMIADWRSRWGYDYPFYFVQLANFTARQTTPEESSWAELREAQTRTLHVENTGMAVTVDIGEASDIHPKNKQEVGRRLALAARAQTYGENIAYSGPLYDGYRIEGNKIRIYFRHTDGGLKTNDEASLKGFTVAGADHKFHWANAVIDGKSVVVSSAEVTLPFAVRYAWANNPEGNLCNGAGLPASPFRTDDWKGMTYGK